MPNVAQRILHSFYYLILITALRFIYQYYSQCIVEETTEQRVEINGARSSAINTVIKATLQKKKK